MSLPHVSGAIAAKFHLLLSANRTNMFAPAGTPAHAIFDLSMLVLGITASIFLVVAGLLFYALIRFSESRVG